MLGKIVTEESEIAFLRSYKDFIYHFNLLERNVAYCIRHCMHSDKWLEVTFDKKVKKILLIAEQASVEKSFEEWSHKMEECRRMRNIIVHGEWDWKDFLEKPINYHCPELNNARGSFSVKEFQGQLDLLHEVFELFMKQRRILEKAVHNSAQQVAGGDGAR